ncbi:MAG: hypothetical protein AAF577_04565 [Pseudomonadota bacterium]
MTTVRQARRFLSNAPVEALSDAAGLASICVMIFIGFAIPTLF